MIIFNLVLFGYQMVSSARAESISVVPSLRLGGQWDSNPFLTGEGGEINHDFITEVSPQIALRSIATRTQYNVTYRLDARQYSHYRELDHESHTATVGVDSVLSQKTSLSLGDTYIFTPDLRDASAAGIQIPMNDTVFNTAFASIQRSLGEASSASLNLVHSTLEFEDDTLFDTQTDVVTLSGNYLYSANTSLTMSYTHAENHYDTPTGSNTTLTHSAQLGINNQLSPSASLGISGGIVYTRNLEDNINYTANANFSKTFQMTSINLTYSRGATNTFGLTNDVNVSDSVSANFARTFSRFFSATLSGNVIKNHSGLIDRISYSANAGFAWRALEWLSIDANFSHYQQWVEDLLGVNMARDQAFISLTATLDELRI